MNAVDIKAVAVDGLSLVHTGGGVMCGRLELGGERHVLVSLGEQAGTYDIGLYEAEGEEESEFYEDTAAADVARVVSTIRGGNQ